MLQQQEPAYSLSTVQQLYHDLSELRTDVQLLEFEWLRTQSEALAALHRVAEVARTNAEVPVPDVPGATVEVDHWTDGGLSSLLAEIEEHTRSATGEQSSLTVDDLRMIIREVAPGCEARLDSLVERAGMRVVASQFRANTAEQVIDALADQGFAFVEETYEGGDFREAHYSKLLHHDSSEVVVEVAPQGDTGMAIRVLSYDDERSQTRRDQRAQDLMRVLRQSGVPVGDATDAGAEPAPEERDFERIRERRRGTG
jgi:cell division protein FtsL